jgi:hypothetical protein
MLGVKATTFGACGQEMEGRLATKFDVGVWVGVVPQWVDQSAECVSVKGNPP